MKLVVDESVDASIVIRLRSDGHEVIYIAEQSPGISDLKVMEIANREQCVLVTSDKDFGELVFRNGSHNSNPFDKLASGSFFLSIWQYSFKAIIFI